MKRRTPILLILAAALLAAPLSACTAGADLSRSATDLLPSGSSAQDPTWQSTTDSAQAESGAPAGGTAGAETDGGSVSAERSVIRTGDVAIQVEHPAESADEVARIAQDLGGSVTTRDVTRTPGTSAASSTLAIRVPSDRFDEAFTRLAELGEVITDTRSSSDVTEQHADLDARVKSLEASVDRLRELMSGSASTADLLEAERALSERQQELDGLRAQLESLEGQVAQASITVSLRAPSALPGGGPATFWDGLLQGVSSLGATGSALLVALGIALPWLAVLAVIALVILLIVRAAIRRGQRKRQAAGAVGAVGAAASTAESAPAAEAPVTPTPGEAP